MACDPFFLARGQWFRSRHLLAFWLAGSGHARSEFLSGQKVYRAQPVGVLLCFVCAWRQRRAKRGPLPPNVHPSFKGERALLAARGGAAVVGAAPQEPRRVRVLEEKIQARQPRPPLLLPCVVGEKLSSCLPSKLYSTDELGTRR